MEPTGWDLFVDESGDFDNFSARVLVAGVVIPSHLLLGREEEIRAQLAGLVPGFPWPLHVCIVRKISTAVVAHLALRIRAVGMLLTEEREALAETLETIKAGGAADPNRIATLEQRLASAGADFASLSLDIPTYLQNHASELAEITGGSRIITPLPDSLWTGEEWGSRPQPHLANAAKLLLEHVRDDAVAATRMMSEGMHPQYELASSLDRVLRENDPALAQVLTGMAFRAIAAIQRTLAAIGAPTCEEPAFLVLASESQPGDFTPPGDGTDRYLSLLEAMLIRVAEILERRDGLHEVRVRVATRRLDYRNLQSSDHFECERHLVPLCQKIQEGHGSSRVKLQATETPKYRHTIHPGWVFVDYAANVSRHAIGNRSLVDTERRVVKETGLPIRSGEPSRTHLQAAGWAWKVLAAQREHGIVTLSVPPNVWPWAVEQMEEWRVR